jgi:tripartite-type tricarboxylate transporter receptor subunit TctC
MNTFPNDSRRRRGVFGLLASALVGLGTLVGSSAWAAFPDKPVKFLVPFAAGSGTDVAARILAVALEPSLGVPVVVENRPGAGGMLGSEMLSKAAPDGYTVGITSSATHSASPYLYSVVPYDPLKGFVHVTNMVGSPMMLVVADGFASDFAEFNAKAKSGKLTFGYGSSTSQVAAGTFAALDKIDALPVPYKGQPQAITDLIGGQVNFVFADAGVLASFIKAGRVKALAITSPERAAKYPNVPTLDELGIKGFDLATWVGLGLPAGTPRDIAERWNREILKVLAREDVREKFANLNVDVIPNGIEVHTAFVQRQLEAWGRRIRQAGLKPE